MDPKTLKIKAIIDWEFGGFWPEWFERPFWERSGASYALEGEEDDTERCRAWLVANCDKIELPHLSTLADKLGPIPWTPEDSDPESSNHKRVDSGSEEVKLTVQSEKVESASQVRSATMGEIKVVGQEEVGPRIQIG